MVVFVTEIDARKLLCVCMLSCYAALPTKRSIVDLARNTLMSLHDDGNI